MDMTALVAAVGAVLNGGWGLRFESKHAEMDGRINQTNTRLDGVEKQSDERHTENRERLQRIESKLDNLLERRGR